MIRFKTIFYTILIFVLSVNFVFAQPVPPDPASPLGEGIGFLLVSGASYLIIRIVKGRKKLIKSN